MAPTPDRSDDSVRDRWRYAGRLVRLLWELSPRAMILNGVVTLAIGLAPLLSLAALKRLVDAATAAAPAANKSVSGSISTALWWAAAFVAAGALQSTIWGIGRVIRDEIQQQLKTRLQERVIAKAQALPLAAFEQPDVYDQLQRIEHGLVNRLFSTMAFLFQIGNEFVLLVSLVVYVGAAHPALPLILTLGTVLFLLVRIRLLREKYVLEKTQTEPQRRLGYLSGLMTGREAAAETRLFGLGDHLLGAWSDLHTRLQNERLALVRRDFRLEGISSSGQTLTFGVALLVVVWLVTRGALSVGEYAAFVGAVQQFQNGMFSLFWDAALVDNDLRFVRDFFLYLDLPEEKTGGARLPGGPLRQGIVFENVRFAYPHAAATDAETRRWVLDGINLHLRPGERLALVGENGAGKTTLAKLLLGLYAPTEGRILVDGVDLAGLDPNDWRRRTAVVFQDFQQYHLSARENIVLGDLSRAEEAEAVARAARLSGAESVVAALPQGYETPLGKAFDESGQDLSLGQWQKIAIARAYLRAHADVLVLDEPTAALDAKAEVAMYRQFRDVSAGKAVLLISHRLGSARLADRILVLDGGKIVEQGSHAVLMERGGLYARMLGTQAQWYA